MIRPAVPDDLAAVVALEADLFGTDAWSRVVVAGELTGPGRTALVAELDDELAGYAIALVVAGVADLVRLGVHPARQRTGVARALLDALLALVRDAGADRMLLEVSAANRAALGLYAGAGFERIDVRRRYYRDQTDAIVLRLPLAADRRSEAT